MCKKNTRNTYKRTIQNLDKSVAIFSTFLQKETQKFSKLRRHSISALVGKELQDVFSFQMYPRITQHLSGAAICAE